MIFTLNYYLIIFYRFKSEYKKFNFNSLLIKINFIKQVHLKSFFVKKKIKHIICNIWKITRTPYNFIKVMAISIMHEEAKQICYSPLQLLPRKLLLRDQSIHMDHTTHTTPHVVNENY